MVGLISMSGSAAEVTAVLKGPSSGIAGVQPERRGEAKTDRHIGQTVPSERSKVRTDVGMAWWGKCDTSSKVPSTVYPGWALELDGPPEQGGSGDDLDSIHLAQSGWIVVNGRSIIGLCDKGIPLSSRRRPLWLEPKCLCMSKRRTQYAGEPQSQEASLVHSYNPHRTAVLADRFKITHYQEKGNTLNVLQDIAD